MTTQPLALLSREARSATLTLNRPEQRNALSPDLLRALHEHVDTLTALPEEEAPTVVGITGAGKAFCAGMDLKQVLGNHELAADLLMSLAELTWKIRRLPAVVVGIVNGPAIGGGCGLATVCDLALTYSENRMGFPEVDLGVCPAVVAPWLVRRIGPGRARRVLLSGGLISGAEAHALGIVTDLVPTRDELGPASAALIERLSKGAPGALRATKSLLNRLDGSDDLEVLREAARLSARVLATPETQAMLRARLES